MRTTGRQSTATMGMLLGIAVSVGSAAACQDQRVTEPKARQNGTTTKGQPAQDTAATQQAGAPAALVRRLHEHRDVTVSMTTGTEHFGKGLVELSIRGDGTVTVDNRAAGKQRSFTGKLTADELAALGPELAAAGFTTLRSPGPPRQPGDTPVVLRVVQGGKELYRGDLWYGDRYQMPGLDRIIKRHDAIVTRLTDGELPY